MKNNTAAETRSIRNLADWNLPILNGQRRRFQTEAGYRSKVCGMAIAMNVLNVLLLVAGQLFMRGLPLLLPAAAAVLTFALYYISDTLGCFRTLLNLTIAAAGFCCALAGIMMAFIPGIGAVLSIVLNVMIEAFGWMAAVAILYFIPGTIAFITKKRYAEAA